jgi:hypothetical protein
LIAFFVHDDSLKGKEPALEEERMNTLPEIIQALQKLIQKPRACCAILSSDCLDESSLMGTKQGYLNLALALLQIVNTSEGQSDPPLETERLSAKNALWSDNLKKSLHQLPGNHPFIVGCYLFDNHRSFLAALEEVVNPSLPQGVKLSNDPAFKEP